jgi:hypothetical protein
MTVMYDASGQSTFDFASTISFGSPSFLSVGNDVAFNGIVLPLILLVKSC